MKSLNEIEKEIVLMPDQEFLVSELRQEAIKWVKVLKKQHKKHMDEEDGSCYCLASNNSCKPEIWNWIMEFFNLTEEEVIE